MVLSYRIQKIYFTILILTLSFSGVAQKITHGIVVDSAIALYPSRSPCKNQKFRSRNIHQPERRIFYNDQADRHAASVQSWIHGPRGPVVI